MNGDIEISLMLNDDTDVNIDTVDGRTVSSELSL